MPKTDVELSLVIPCFNEAKRLGATVRDVLAFLDTRPHRAELLLVDDGSTDGTLEVMRAASAGDARVRVVASPSNQGKGAAVRRGVAASRGRVVAFFDADLSYPLETLDRAQDELEAGALVVIGGRDLDPDEALGSYSLARRVASVAWNALVDAALSLDIPDTQCGFKVFEGETARSLFSATTIDRFGFDVEILHVARAWGLPIARIPVRMTHREGSTVRFVRDSVQMATDILRIRRRAAEGRYDRARFDDHH